MAKTSTSLSPSTNLNSYPIELYPSDLAELLGVAAVQSSGGNYGGNDYSEDYSNGRDNDGGSLGGSDNPQDHYSNRNNGGYDNSTDDNGYNLDSEILAANYVSDQAPELG